ncbi:hypothetical protein [Martelella endophytica]|nr:hypothetical protein [Martelella endophytica]
MASDAGALHAPFPVRVPGPRGYHLVSSSAKSELRRVRLFRRWILEQTSL